MAVGGQAFSTMIEGEKTFDITVRWPEKLRGNESAILDIPIDAVNNTVTAGNAPSTRADAAGRRRHGRQRDRLFGDITDPLWEIRQRPAQQPDLRAAHCI